MESMQEVEAQEKWVEPRKLLGRAKYFGAAGRDFEVEEKPPKIGAVSTEGQAVFQVEIAEIVVAGAGGSEMAGNGLWRLDYLAGIVRNIVAGYGQMWE